MPEGNEGYKPSEEEMVEAVTRMTQAQTHGTIERQQIHRQSEFLGIDMTKIKPELINQFAAFKIERERSKLVGMSGSVDGKEVRIEIRGSVDDPKSYSCFIDDQQTSEAKAHELFEIVFQAKKLRRSAEQSQEAITKEKEAGFADSVVDDWLGKKNQ